MPRQKTLSDVPSTVIVGFLKKRKGKRPNH